MAKILCLDQSSHTSGYSVFETSSAELIAYGHFTFSDTTLEARLVKIRAEVQFLIAQYQPTKIYLEDIQYQTNVASGVTTYKTLAEVIGVISELVTELNLPFELVHAASWKSTCGVRGKARADQKRNAAAFVSKTYGIQPTQDECDSICIGTHVCRNQKTCAW